MGHCTVCEQFHPFTLTSQFKCEGCQTELKLATSTIVKAIVVPVLIIVPGALLLEPVIGKGGIIALGLIVGNIRCRSSFSTSSTSSRRRGQPCN